MPPRYGHGEGTCRSEMLIYDMLQKKVVIIIQGKTEENNPEEYRVWEILKVDLLVGMTRRRHTCPSRSTR